MTARMSLNKRRILLAVTGSVAAYKAIMLYRLLSKSGADVRVVLSHSATQFIGTASFSAFGAKVYSNMWSDGGEQHVELGSWAECILVAPATADAMARIRYGRADELLTATLLCSAAPLVIAPAMHPDMWQGAATQDNVSILSERGAHFIGPVTGLVASGDSGQGRFIEPTELVEDLSNYMARRQLLEGKHLLLSAGPTLEKLDAVRALTNISSGKMGYALAKAAREQGALVTLVSGPVDLSPPPGVELIQVQTAEDMLHALRDVMKQHAIDSLIMAAAVADFRIHSPSSTKLKKEEGLDRLNWVENPDIIATIARERTEKKPFLVAFALESTEGDALIELARNKLRKKGVDLIIANSTHQALGRDDTEIYLVDEAQAQCSGPVSKQRAAQLILAHLTAHGFSGTLS